MKRILITGATGFIGSSLIEKLVNSRDEKYELVATGREIKPWNTKFEVKRQYVDAFRIL